MSNCLIIYYVLGLFNKEKTFCTVETDQHRIFCFENLPAAVFSFHISQLKYTRNDLNGNVSFQTADGI